MKIYVNLRSFLWFNCSCANENCSFCVRKYKFVSCLLICRAGIQKRGKKLQFETGILETVAKTLIFDIRNKLNSMRKGSLDFTIKISLIKVVDLPKRQIKIKVQKIGHLLKNWES